MADMKVTLLMHVLLVWDTISASITPSHEVRFPYRTWTRLGEQICAFNL